MADIDDSVFIAVPCDTAIDDGVPFDRVGRMYLRALSKFANVVPLMLSAVMGREAQRQLVSIAHGLLLTGSESNVDPRLYGSPFNPDIHGPLDPARDAMTLPLIRDALTQGLPILGICRGCQELVVATGGVLETEIQTLPGRIDHRAPDHPDLDVCFAPRHAVDVVPGTLLSNLTRQCRLTVNSLHRQAAARLGAGWLASATAQDGTIEAVEWEQQSSEQFVLGVQWHPEAAVERDPVSHALFEGFVASARRYREQRQKRHLSR